MCTVTGISRLLHFELAFHKTAAIVAQFPHSLLLHLAARDLDQVFAGVLSQ